MAERVILYQETICPYCGKKERYVQFLGYFDSYGTVVFVPTVVTCTLVVDKIDKAVSREGCGKQYVAVLDIKNHTKKIVGES